ncbi:MAG: 4Fe-4S dicluster domain-containing protein, partial [Nitrospinota bacterium]
MGQAAPPAAVMEAPERAARGGRGARSPFRSPFGPDRDLVQNCIHCGLCTMSCPTFVLVGNEMDSPRGRIYLMRMVADGFSELTPAVQLHLDRCLDCRACETACPSGVKYGALIEAAKAAMEPHRGRGSGARLLRWFLYRQVLPSRRWLLLLALLGRFYQRSGLQALFRRAGGARLLPARLRAIEPLMPEVPPLATMRRLPECVPAEGGERFR